MRKVRRINKLKIKGKKPNIRVGNTGKFYNSLFIDLGKLVIFTGQVIKQFFTPPFEHKELVRQFYHAGNKSFALVALTGFIIGLVLTLQIRPILVMFGAQSLLPGMVAISMFREIGPIITGLICAGKISSGIAAEIGAMKVTEQIDAMEVSGTKPLGYVVATRVLATTVMVPMLVFFSNALSLFGSFLAMNLTESMSVQLYILNAFKFLEFIDVVPATIKTFVFGFFIGLIGSYKGYQADRGTESVGMGANSAVVTASLTIFLVDLIAVLITNMFSTFSL